MACLADFDLAQLQLYADNQERVLICRHGECGYALSAAASQATSHLRDKHDTPKALRDGLTRYLKHQHAYSFRNPTDIAPRRDGSQVHRMLRLHNGFACRECPYRTVNHNEMSRHISKEHLSGRQTSRQRIDPDYDDVYLQTWTYGATWRYWTVERNGSTIRPIDGREAGEHIQLVHDRERMRAEEQKRI